MVTEKIMNSFEATEGYDAANDQCKKLGVDGIQSPSKKRGRSDEEKRHSRNKERFRYGNYNRYYGTRIKEKFEKDPRLNLLPEQWFKDRAVLDIGCNVGYLTLSIAKEFGPNRVLGIDIDENLVGVARKNIRHYCDKGTELIGNFPASLATDSLTTASNLTDRRFPKNVWFRKENYVLECDEMLEMVKEEFHVILALSITKWIHLNWGDDGLRRFFKRTFLHLCKGGRLILEPQEFSSYSKKSKITADMQKNYKAIAFEPKQFAEYLLSEEVGFERVEELGIPEATSKGFERPILAFVKSASGKEKRKQDI